MSRGQRLTALIVNYNSGSYTWACAVSLELEWQALGRDRADLELIVVDNASPSDQSEQLAHLEERGVKVVRSRENLGYAGGMNLGLASSAEDARPDDLVAILNPDLYFLPGSLGVLVDYISTHPDVGAVDPRAFIDPACGLNLPRNLLPTLVDHTWMALAQMSPAVCRAYSRRRLKKALPWWRAEEPLEAEMLSGCCLFLRRGVVDELPHLMDPRYPLYYEDTDLFRELVARGYKLVHHGGARVLHHWSRSTGLVGGAAETEAGRRYAVAQEAYYRKFYGGLGAAWVRLVNKAVERWPRKLYNRPMHALVELGSFVEPIHVDLPRDSRFLVEMGMAPNWLLSAGIFGTGTAWTCPPETWAWFFQARYFMRILDVDSGELLGAWTFEKSVPGRDNPMDPAEFDHA
ncbi:MAG: glycosyltransferase [Planctomycetota bacterium]|nr:glycosyltransferase [Planctomycetota bacterium]